jgi:predicted outer membrane repeat protein
MKRRSTGARRALAIVAALSLTAGFSAKAYAIPIQPFTATFVVNTTTDAHSSFPINKYHCAALAPALGKCTLRAAIEQASAWTGLNRTFKILVPAGHYYLNQSSMYGALRIHYNSVNIYGNGSSRTIVDAGPPSIYGGCHYGIDSVFWNQANALLQGMEIRDGRSYEGGGVLNTGGGSLVLSNDLIDCNEATYGGGVDSYGLSVQITNTEISHNTADSNGGGINSTDPVFSLDRVDIHDNSANEGGGGWNADYLSVNNSTIHDNTADDRGGGLWNRYHLEVTGSSMTNNHADYQGGALYNDDYAALDHVTLNDNSAYTVGGAIYNSDKLWVTGQSVLSGNTSTDAGGAIYSTDDVTLTDVQIVNNQASDPSSSGGGVYSDDENWFTNVTFSNNTAGYGGGIYFYDSDCGGCVATRLTLQSNTLTGNTATYEGGGMYIDAASTNYPPAPVRINDTQITGNTAGTDWGGLRNPDGSAVCSGTTSITGNTPNDQQNQC